MGVSTHRTGKDAAAKHHREKKCFSFCRGRRVYRPGCLSPIFTSLAFPRLEVRCYSPLMRDKIICVDLSKENKYIKNRISTLRKQVMHMVSAKTRFWILIALVFISGFSQGMILPLMGIILEQNDVSSAINGLHATGLYIGVLIASPFMEKPIRKFGFKPLIMLGGVLVFASLALFPVWQSLWFWFILRVMIGIGDNMLHFGTQTWITTTSVEESRGKNISYYGLSFGLGFTIGPLMTRLLEVHQALPFLVSAALSLAVWSLMFAVRNNFQKTITSQQAQVP